MSPVILALLLLFSIFESKRDINHDKNKPMKNNTEDTVMFYDIDTERTNSTNIKNIPLATIRKSFVLPQNLENPGEEFVNIGFNFQMGTELEPSKIEKYKTELSRFFNSIFMESTGTSINFLAFTTTASKEMIIQIIKETIGRILIRQMVKRNTHNEKKSWKFPRFRVQFISIEHFQLKYKRELDLYSSLLCNLEGDLELSFTNQSQIQNIVDFLNESSPIRQVIKDANDGTLMKIFTCDKRFIKDLFYIQFLFGSELPNFINRLIFVDIDLRFRTDVGLVDDNFSLMNRGEIFALAKDWSIDHVLLSYKHRETHKKSSWGYDGPYQVVNSGLVLMNLERLRARPELVTPQYFARLKAKYKYATYADQSAYHILKYEHPDLVYMLPCVYNFMVHFADLKGSNIIKYNFCSGKPEIEHLCGGESKALYPVLFRFNYLFKLSTWCLDSSWRHCF